MNIQKITVLVHNIRLPLDESVEYAFAYAKRKLRRLGVSLDGAACRLYRKSVDSRKKNDVHFVVSVAVGPLVCRLTESECQKEGLALLNEATLSCTQGELALSVPPLIVGSGPAGLFCALLLAEKGYCPIVLERGGSVEQRKRAVRAFYETKILDTNTNIQFGAGGAGTFSDGKLVTRINDPLSSYVLSRFVEFGAPEEILYLAKPHVGTDILSGIVDRMLTKIEALGGRVYYNTCFLSYSASGGRVKVAHTTRGDFQTDLLILATGHSSRDTYRALMKADLAIEPKPFSVGMRIEHLAREIDESMYGEIYAHPALTHAEYNLSYDTKNRGVYTFCMCPGGEVVAATSEEGRVVVNGMSHHARDGKNSNSAVVCSVFTSDYGNTSVGALDFIDRIERAAYAAAGSTYATPLCTVGDFLQARDAHHEPSVVQPTYMQSGFYKLCAPEKYLPSFVTEQIRAALVHFDKRIHGFASSHAILSGAETRTSSPLRITRDPLSRLAIGYHNLYPVGEGAGYAGGITSAAIDGIRCALQIISKYAPIL